MPICAVNMATTFGWSKTQSGVVMGGFFWGYCFTQVLGGHVSDRWVNLWWSEWEKQWLPIGICVIWAWVIACYIMSMSEAGNHLSSVLWRLLCLCSWLFVLTELVVNGSYFLPLHPGLPLQHAPLCWRNWASVPSPPWWWPDSLWGYYKVRGWKQKVSTLCLLFWNGLVTLITAAFSQVSTTLLWPVFVPNEWMKGKEAFWWVPWAVALIWGKLYM